jgi:hypothetical protein
MEYLYEKGTILLPQSIPSGKAELQPDQSAKVFPPFSHLSAPAPAFIGGILAGIFADLLAWIRHPGAHEGPTTPCCFIGYSSANGERFYPLPQVVDTNTHRLLDVPGKSAHYNKIKWKNNKTVCQPININT